MRYQVVFRREARDEAVEAADYIARQGFPDNALRWYEGLTDAITSLERMPERCPLARENGCIPGIELRQLLYKSHRLIFSIKGREVHVLHVRHAARQDLDAL